MRPDSISAVANSRLRFDQTLRARRGVKRCRYDAESRPRACPSIHPKHSAACSASMYVTLATPEPLRANLIHTPGAEAWCSRSHASHSSAVAKARVGRSDESARLTAPTLRRDVLEALVAGLDAEHADDRPGHEER